MIRPLLEFAIPTWKRPAQLRLSVCSIVEQGCPVVISHHACDVETLPVGEQLKKDYPKYVRAVQCELGANPDYSDSFRQLFKLPDAQYTWPFGDDDALVPGAVTSIVPLLERGEFDFIHVAEPVRSQNSNRLVKGKLLDLCNNLGWIDMTGFISSNIIRTVKLDAMCQLPSWELYAKNAFVQCCAIFDVLHDSPAAFWDAALVDSQILAQPDETQKRWDAGKIGLRYHYIDDTLLDMRARGVLGEVTPKFFRYHSYHIWDRFLANIVNSYATTENFIVTEYLDDMLLRCMNLASLLSGHDRKQYQDEIIEVRQAMIEHSGAFQYAVRKAEYMNRVSEDHSARERYDFAYMAPVLGADKARDA